MMTVQGSVARRVGHRLLWLSAGVACGLIAGFLIGLARPRPRQE